MSPDEFETKIIMFMSRIDEHMLNQDRRSDSHAAELRGVRADIKSLQDSRTFINGMLELATKTAAVALGISGVIYGWIECFGQGGRLK